MLLLPLPLLLLLLPLHSHSLQIESDKQRGHTDHTEGSGLFSPGSELKLSNASRLLARKITKLLPGLRNQSEEARVGKDVEQEVEMFLKGIVANKEQEGSTNKVRVQVIGEETKKRPEKQNKENKTADRTENDGKKDKCGENPCNSQAVCVSVGASDYRCSCHPGHTSLVKDGRAAVYLKHFQGKVCVPNKSGQPQGQQKDKKHYMGTLNGGLNLTGDSREQAAEPVIGVVDDLVEAKDINVDKMIGEHFSEPEHFGIHISKLENLPPSDRVKNSKKDMSIISSMFD